MSQEGLDVGEQAASFQSLTAEGDLLFQKSSLLKAAGVYSRALDLKPLDKNTLVKRSKCYILMGQFKEALIDAEVCLKEDAGYHKAIFLKAEALYAQGDFELALVHFHRGNKVRPELAEFRVGISKSREAINNSIGSSATNPGDPKRKISLSSKVRRALQLGEKAEPEKPKSSTQKPLTSSMESKLLEELYHDKVYLSKMLKDSDFRDHPDEDIESHVHEGLKYLSSRIGFWRQQNPLYARRKLK